MSRQPARTPLARAAVGFAAAVTFCAAVVMDLVAGEHPLHATTLGVVALVVGLVRVRLAGSHSGCFATVSGVIVAQPAQHAVMKLLSPAADHAAGPVQHAAETSISFTHVLVAAVIVAAVAGAQRLFLLLAAVRLFDFLLLLVRVPVRSVRAVPVTDAAATPVKPTSLIRVIPLRGPPGWVQAAA